MSSLRGPTKVTPSGSTRWSQTIAGLRTALPSFLYSRYRCPPVSTKLAGSMAPPSPGSQTMGPSPRGRKGPSGPEERAAPTHLRLAVALGAVKYMRYLPSARRETSGAHKPQSGSASQLTAQDGLAGRASPRTVQGPVADGAAATGTCRVPLLVE